MTYRDPTATLRAEVERLTRAAVDLRRVPREGER